MDTNKILVVVDVQNDFIDGSLLNEDAIKTVPNIVTKIDEFNGDLILVTMDTHHENYMTTNEGIKLPVEHCIKDTDGWNLNPLVKSSIEEAEKRGISVLYFEKPTFGSEALVKFVKGLNGKLEIEVVGFCTDICVVSNVLLMNAAVYDRADITVISNCCAGVTPESHNAALTTMKMCQINIV